MMEARFLGPFSVTYHSMYTVLVYFYDFNMARGHSHTRTPFSGGGY